MLSCISKKEKPEKGDKQAGKKKKVEKRGFIEKVLHSILLCFVSRIRKVIDYYGEYTH